MTSPHCLFCNQKFEVADLLSRMGGYATSTDSGVAQCPSCEKPLEFRVRSSVLELGYTYFGGSMHFEAFEVFHVSGLRMHRSGSMVTIEYHGVQYPLPQSV